MKKIISTFVAVIMLFSSFGAFALDVQDAYTEFKTLHPEFVNSLINNGISEELILSFLHELYDYILEIDSYTPVTEENFEKYAIEAINNVTSREEYYSIQDTLIILYPSAIKLAITEGKVSEDFQPLAETVKRLLFEDDTLVDNAPTDSSNSGNNSFTAPPAPIIKPNMFTDINESHWAYTSVSYLADNFILNGYLDGTFKPENNITRAEFAKIIVSSTDTYDDAAVSTFGDVSTDDWYYSYVSTAYKLGYITGYPDGTFRPDDNITRADICTIVNRVLKAVPDGSVSAFTDDWAMPSYAHDSVYALAAKGIVNGYTDGTFAPTAYATRAQTAKIIYSALFLN